MEDSAPEFEITNLPTSLLVAKDGSSWQKWGSLAQSAELAMAIESELGDAVAIKHFGRTGESGK